MLLEITTTAPNATDLGYLLHKNPANVFERGMGFGTARVFYPEATEQKCTAVLWLDLDQASLVRRHGDQSFSLSQYVNDRPYVASSFLSVAIAQSFASALGGRCKERPERVNEPWPLSVTIPAVDCDAGEPFIRGIFEPLGYSVTCEPMPLDAKFEAWGVSTLYRLTLAAETTVQQLLTHLYILLPVLDNQKHYSFGEDEVAKLVENAGDWLAEHPIRETITRRFLRYKRQFVFDALEKLASSSADEDSVSVEVEEAEDAAKPEEKTINLHDQRLVAVAEVLKAGGGSRIVDLGCGDGKLLRLLIRDRQWTEILGMDVASRELQIASRRLRLDRDEPSSRIRLIQGSLLYRDERIAGYDAAALVEVIEHIELDRLGFLERSIFGYAKPKRVVVTTPNADYNSHWETLHADQFRHADHRFEWSRAQFESWTYLVAANFGYTVKVSGIGEVDGELGAPSQMAVFDREWVVAAP